MKFRYNAVPFSGSVSKEGIASTNTIQAAPGAGRALEIGDMTLVVGSNESDTVIDVGEVGGTSLLKLTAAAADDLVGTHPLSYQEGLELSENAGIDLTRTNSSDVYISWSGQNKAVTPPLNQG